MAEIGQAVCAEYESRGLTGRAIFWHRDRARIIADLQRFLHADTARRSDQGTRPVAAELAFGLSGAPLGTVGLPLPDGRTVGFRGKADRVDVAVDGSLHVIDYKTGRADGYKGLCEDEPDLGGRRLQLAVYGEAARLFAGSPHAHVRAEYWFTSAKGDFARIGYSVTPEVIRRVGRTVGSIVGGIEAGVFPNHPTATSTDPWVACPFCDPDALGVAELRRHFERKRADPAMAAFAELADPGTEVETDVTTEAGGQAVTGDD